jgi:cytochrome c oxidase subunit 3
VATRETAPELAEHFQDLEQQEHASHLGMWLFLTSEVLLFGALFALYTAYRVDHAAAFAEASSHNDQILGTVNTVILITSSFTVAWAVHSIRRNETAAAAWSLAITIGFGLLFLVVKAIEYSHHFDEGILPGQMYHFAELPGAGAQLFFTLYYLMTGLHALHVIAGLCLLSVLLVQTLRQRYSAKRRTAIELGGLYWHLIDVIWIFLWPLMYLVV